MSSKSTKKIETIKIETKYLLLGALEKRDLAITMQYNHLTQTMHVNPENGDRFVFCHSEPEVVQGIAELMIVAAKKAKELQDA